MAQLPGYKFLLFSQNNEETTQILNQLPHDHNYRIQVVNNISLVFQELAGEEFGACLFNTQVCNVNTIHVINQLRQATKKLSVVIISGIIEPDAQARLLKMKNILALEKPLNETDLDKICQKIVRGAELAQRAHKRFESRQAVVLENMLTSSISIGNMFNVSKGGAYLHLSSGTIHKGDILKITVQLESLKKRRVIYATAIWVDEKTSFKKHVGLGLKFVSLEEANNLLLDKL